MSEYTESEMKAMLNGWRAPDAEIEQGGLCEESRSAHGSNWFQHEPTHKGWYWVYEIGNMKDRPDVFYWDGCCFLTTMKWDRQLTYKTAWSCSGPLRPPKIPKPNGQAQRWRGK